LVCASSSIQDQGWTPVERRLEIEVRQRVPRYESCRRGMTQAFEQAPRSPCGRASRPTRRRRRDPRPGARAPPRASHTSSRRPERHRRRFFSLPWALRVSTSCTRASSSSGSGRRAPCSVHIPRQGCKRSRPRFSSSTLTRATEERPEYGPGCTPVPTARSRSAGTPRTAATRSLDQCPATESQGRGRCGGRHDVPPESVRRGSDPPA